MAKCGACGKKFLQSTGAVSCTICPAMFHRGCLMVSDTALISKDWACPDCKKKTRRGDNSSTPVRGISGNIVQDHASSRLVVASQPHSGASQATDNAGDDSAVSSRDLSRQLVECMTEMREFRKEMAELRASVSGFTERLDSFERRLEVVEQRQTPTGAEVAELERTVTLLKLELNDRDQDALLSDLEIGHLPEERGENVVHTVSVLAAKLGVPLEERDIVFAERIGAVPVSTGSPGGDEPRGRRVVVRLARRHLRDELLRAARVRRSITTVELGLAAPPRRLYVNERLTRGNRQLFHRVREACRKHLWRYSWTKRGRIYARQGDGKPACCIRTDDDFDRIFGSDVV